MAELESNSELLTLFKALADKNRLKIIGLLAQQSHNVEELASALSIGASTVSHHLSVLSKAGLVEGKVQGYYSVYSLQTRPLETTAKYLLHWDELKGLASDSAGEDVFERKIIATFVTPEGRIKAFPVQEKKVLVLIRYMLREFKPGIEYTEKQVNQMLAKFTKDTARVRRAFVDYKYMAREGGGGKYWRI
ncbi:MAG: DUF2087 domain-containing protein [Bacteroidetes bacterium]|nr:MAG: DUF2087 domain-containing protein [Bacteroidota bacterium]